MIVGWDRAATKAQGESYTARQREGHKARGTWAGRERGPRATREPTHEECKTDQSTETKYHDCRRRGHKMIRREYENGAHDGVGGKDQRS